LRAKFRNDWNFLVREIGRGRDVEERSLEMTEVSREGRRRWWRQDRNPVCKYYGKKIWTLTVS